MTAPKRRPVKRTGWRGTVSRHPKITLTAVATVVGILGVVAPWALTWEAKYQRAEAARDHASNDDRRFAWMQFGQLRTEGLLLRNRLNDCAVAVAAGKKQSALEVAVCAQYEADWHDVDERAKAARKKAQERSERAEAAAKAEQ